MNYLVEIWYEGHLIHLPEVEAESKEQADDYVFGNIEVNAKEKIDL